MVLLCTSRGKLKEIEPRALPEVWSIVYAPLFLLAVPSRYGVWVPSLSGRYPDVIIASQDYFTYEARSHLLFVVPKSAVRYIYL
jgi:hypothetical protein